MEEGRESWCHVSWLEPPNSRSHRLGMAGKMIKTKLRGNERSGIGSHEQPHHQS